MMDSRELEIMQTFIESLSDNEVILLEEMIFNESEEYVAQ